MSEWANEREKIKIKIKTTLEEHNVHQQYPKLVFKLISLFRVLVKVTAVMLSIFTFVSVSLFLTRARARKRSLYNSLKNDGMLIISLEAWSSSSHTCYKYLKTARQKPTRATGSIEHDYPEIQSSRRLTFDWRRKCNSVNKRWHVALIYTLTVILCLEHVP